MPETNEKLEPKKNDKQIESLEDSKKIDLYINNQEKREQGVSMMNVFSRLKARFHIYLFVMISTLLLGLLIPTFIYTFKDKKEAAVAILGFDYDGASEEKAPDGGKLDITRLKSSYVIQNALENVTLSKEVTTAQVQSNISITRPLTDETRREQEIINELKEAKNNGYADMVKNFVLKYRQQYFISLKNGFSSTNSSKTYLSAEDLSHLLSAIVTSYNEYFIEEYQDRTLPDNYLAAIDDNSLDYLEILDSVSSSLNYLATYCDEKATVLPNYKTKDGISFSDLSEVIRTLQSVDINYIYSYVYLNNIYKDKLVLQTYYEMQKRNATLNLNELTTNIANLEDRIKNFQEGKVLVQTTDGGAPVEVIQTDPEKTALVIQLTDMYEQKSSLEQQIAMLTDRINKLEGPEASEEEKAKANEYIQTALLDARKIYDIVNNSAQELFESNAYKSSFMHALTTTQKEKFSDNIKLFVIGASAGLFIGLIAWFVDAFLLEFRAYKKNNEAKEGK